MTTPKTLYRACIVCHHAAAVSLYCRFDTLDYVQCGECGLVYVDRFANDDEMRSAYTGGAIRKLRRRLMAPFRKLKHHRHYQESMARARQIFQFVESQLPRRANAIEFLDVGCNRGYLLNAALERGAAVHGIELVREIMLPFFNTYPQLRERIFSEKLSAVATRLPDARFDLITAIDVIEHFEDPAADMRQIFGLVRDDGAFVIQTPDTGCREAKQTRCAWGALKPLEHLHLFDRNNFTVFANALGFRSVQFYEPFEHADGNFTAVLKK